MTEGFNPNYGIPLASYTEKTPPTFDNATWLSTVGSPPPEMAGQACEWHPDTGWRLIKNAPK